MSNDAEYGGETLLAIPIADAYLWCLGFLLEYLKAERDSGAAFRTLIVLNNSVGATVRQMEDLCASSDFMRMEYLGRFSNGNEAIVASRNHAIGEAKDGKFPRLFFLDCDNPPCRKPNSGEIKSKSRHSLAKEIADLLELTEDQTPIVWKHAYEPEPVIDRMTAMLQELEARGPVGAVAGRYRMRGMAKKGGTLPAGTVANTARFDVADPEVQRCASDYGERFIPALGLPFGFTMFPRPVFELLTVSMEYGSYGTEDYPVMDRLRAGGYKLWLSKQLYARHMVFDSTNNRIGAY